MPRLLILATVSCLCTLLSVELILRCTLTIEDLFGPLLIYPTLASEGWARAFERDYGDMRMRAEIGADLGGYLHDPLLGWDVPGRIRQDELICIVPDHSRRLVVVVGDSFAYGAEVESIQSFPAQLQTLLPDTEVLNMGVRAYGVDQAALKLWMFGYPLRPAVVIFAIFGPDYYRTPLSFYRFAKPHFEMDQLRMEMTLRGAPVPPPDEIHSRLEAGLPFLSYGYALARRELLLSSSWQHLTDTNELFFYRFDEVHEEILRRTVIQARDVGARVLFVYIPQASELVSGGWPPSAERAHLARIFSRAGIDFVDLVPALLERHDRSTTDALYIWTDGRAGHFTPETNREVAEILADALERPIDE